MTMLLHREREHPPLILPKRWLECDWRHVRELVEQAHAGDEHARGVLNDWCLEEGRPGGASWLLWSASKPTDYQKTVTRLIIGRETVPENYAPLPIQGSGLTMLTTNDHAFPTFFREAKRQLELHTHAPWARIVTPNAMQAPRGAEVLIDWSFYKTCEAVRSRCNVQGCLNESIGAVAKQPKHEGTGELFASVAE